MTIQFTQYNRCVSIPDSFIYVDILLSVVKGLYTPDLFDFSNDDLFFLDVDDFILSSLPKN